MTVDRRRVCRSLAALAGLLVGFFAVLLGPAAPASAHAVLVNSDPASVGLLLPWSRGQESEADHLGLVYMAKAGYHPSAARDLWVRMGQASGGSGQPEFLSTHPSEATRIKQIEGWIPEALKHYRPQP